METGSILDAMGREIVGVMAPVSICMLVVVLLVYTVYNPSDNSSTAATIRSAANLVYLESPSDSSAEKLEGAVLNAVVFITIITLLTFLLVLLYYYRCINFLVYYTRFSVFMIFSTMGSSILIAIIQRFNLPVDAVTFCILLYNFTLLGTLSFFSDGMPIIVKQTNTVLLGIIVAAWFSRLPEWTTWVLLVALSLYDLVAVLAPGGPLKMLVDLASSRDEELPALLYESRPNTERNSMGSSLGLLVAAAAGHGSNDDGNGGAVELQVLLSNTRNDRINTREGEYSINVVEVNSTNEVEIVDEREDIGETSPLIGNGSSRADNIDDSRRNADHLERIPDVNAMTERNRDEGNETNPRGIRLGMGDFIFYSVLVGRAAMYDLMTVYACYLAIISGLGCTLILLAVFRQALPALPISISLGVMFYFLTRLLLEPFVVGTSTKLVIF